MRSDTLRKVIYKIKNTLAIVLIIAACMTAGAYLHKCQSSPGNIPSREAIETDTITVYDTIPYYYPVVRDSVVIRYETYRVAMAGDKSPGHEQKEVSSEEADIRDSAIVELPVIQRHYADSIYEAWISGPIDPRLDSLRVFAPTTVITRSEWKPPKRWHLGPTVGLGYTPHGFEPFIGISLTYSIIDL